LRYRISEQLFYNCSDSDLFCSTEEPIYIVYWIKEPVPEMPSWVIITLEKLAYFRIKIKINVNKLNSKLDEA